MAGDHFSFTLATTLVEARLVEAVLIKSRVMPSELLDAIGHKIIKPKPKGGH